MQKAIFYHAGCPVCVAAENKILDLVDKSKFDLEVVHFADQKSRINEAEQKGVKSVPALLLGNDVFHINYGASLEDVRKS